MHLKNIQIVGFKSFADKASLEIMRGVTAIVGPNGCGKSNVSDAIRWALGEQSAKALRGGEMADVIFNGSEQRKPLGMAEVSLTFADCKEALSTGQMAGMDANFDEVTVTRRVFRDGNSEYLINKTLCRLKDIQTLFMDTGIGRSSYSIMEQGKIDKVLSSHPDDRRSIFEEAAGITKFRSQKKEALRKLEYTEANLLRITDVIRELKRQINSLQRQVGKARRYQALTEEVRRLDAQLGRHEYEEIGREIQCAEQELGQIRGGLDRLRSEIESGEGRIADLRAEGVQIEQQRQQIFQRQRDVQSEVERHETRIRSNLDRVNEGRAANESAERELAQARERLAHGEAECRVAQEKLEGLRASEGARAEALAAAQTALSQAEAKAKEQNLGLQRTQAAILSAEGGIANLRNQVGSHERENQELLLRVQRLITTRNGLLETRQGLVQKLEAMQTEVTSFRATFEDSRHAVVGSEEDLREAERQCQEIIAGISENQKAFSEKRSRREVLRQLHDSYEGYLEGAQALLRRSVEAAGGGDMEAFRSTVLGTLADLIDVEPRYSLAIEAGLGQALQAIVVADGATALRIAEQLRQGDLGRAILAIKEEESNFSLAGSLPREPLAGALCWASDVVQARPMVAAFIRNLLADMVIVEDLARAIELQKLQPSLTFVTNQGDVLDHHGILSAGSPKAMPLQLIGRRNEIAALDEEIARLEAVLHDLSARKGEWEGRRVLARQSLGDRQSDLRLKENDLTRRDLLLTSIQSEIRDADARISASEMESRDAELRGGEVNAERARLAAQLQEAQAHQDALKAEFSSALATQEESAREREQAAQGVNDLRVAMATMRQEISGLEMQARLLDAQIQEGRQLIARRELEIREATQRIAEWEGENAEAEHRIAALRESVAGIQSEVAAADHEKERVETAIHETSEALRRSRQEIEGAQKAITDHEVQLTGRRGDVGHLVDRIQREYTVDLATVKLLPLRGQMDGALEPTEAPTVEVPPTEAPVETIAETEGGEEPLPEPIPTIEPTQLDFASWDDVALRVAELRAKIQSMGPVNVEAVREFEELEGRYNFMSREMNDLTTSKEQLLEILRKINLTTRQMFAETFVKIRENFQGVFSELFGGGKADLILVDENDPLECGIEIVARPPGKQLQSIMLLSGGERTMTAVSLLFAIYMVKPSPFCVLDEMDAPLDESNINRFIGMLERFLVHSQFLIITHNKRTIGMADALYGVTMPERGVSKLVSVKFHGRKDGAKTLPEPHVSTPTPTPVTDAPVSA